MAMELQGYQRQIQGVPESWADVFDGGTGRWQPVKLWREPKSIGINLGLCSVEGKGGRGYDPTTMTEDQAARCQEKRGRRHFVRLARSDLDLI